MVFCHYRTCGHLWEKGLEARTDKAHPLVPTDYPRQAGPRGWPQNFVAWGTNIDGPLGLIYLALPSQPLPQCPLCCVTSASQGVWDPIITIRKTLPFGATLF